MLLVQGYCWYKSGNLSTFVVYKKQIGLHFKGEVSTQLSSIDQVKSKKKGSSNEYINFLSCSGFGMCNAFFMFSNLTKDTELINLFVPSSLPVQSERTTPAKAVEIVNMQCERTVSQQAHGHQETCCS